MKLNWPSSRELSAPPRATGREIRADTSRDGYVDDGNIAWPERIVQARRQWTQARPEDFDKVGKRLWRDKATGVEYHEESGAPLLSIGTDAARFVSAFFVRDGRLVFLVNDTIPQETVVVHGEVIARELPSPAATAVIQ